MNALGKFLRKLRIDHDEVLKHMASKLGVSSSFLSAVEHNKKRMPSSWIRDIPAIYSLSQEQIAEFESAIAETNRSIEINFNDVSESVKRSAAVTFARRFDDIDEDLAKQLLKILKKGDD
jgi:transcriptional regulator with XRE-family HTH domain